MSRSCTPGDPGFALGRSFLFLPRRLVSQSAALLAVAPLPSLSLAPVPSRSQLLDSSQGQRGERRRNPGHDRRRPPTPDTADDDRSGVRLTLAGAVARRRGGARPLVDHVTTDVPVAVGDRRRGGPVGRRCAGHHRRRAGHHRRLRRSLHDARGRGGGGRGGSGFGRPGGWGGGGGHRHRFSAAGTGRGLRGRHHLGGG